MELCLLNLALLGRSLTVFLISYDLTHVFIVVEVGVVLRLAGVRFLRRCGGFGILCVLEFSIRLARLIGELNVFKMP